MNFANQRRSMIQNQLVKRGITDQSVIRAFKQVRRHLFVPKKFRHLAYQDRPLPISLRQTISQPYIVALSCQLLKTKPDHIILDVGTGSGYQAAILSQLVAQVFTIEIIPKLAQQAKNRLQKLGYNNIKVLKANAKNGLPTLAPFDGIKSAAAVKQVPLSWKKQLKTGGHIVAPISENGNQQLIRLTKKEKSFFFESFGPVRFVPFKY